MALRHVTDDVTQRTLLRKYALSNNVSLDGVRMRLNSSHLTDAGAEEEQRIGRAHRTSACQAGVTTELASVLLWQWGIILLQDLVSPLTGFQRS